MNILIIKQPIVQDIPNNPQSSLLGALFFQILSIFRYLFNTKINQRGTLIFIIVNHSYILTSIVIYLFNKLVTTSSKGCHLDQYWASIFLIDSCAAENYIGTSTCAMWTSTCAIWTSTCSIETTSRSSPTCSPSLKLS